MNNIINKKIQNYENINSATDEINSELRAQVAELEDKNTELEMNINNLKEVERSLRQDYSNIEFALKDKSSELKKLQIEITNLKISEAVVKKELELAKKS